MPYVREKMSGVFPDKKIFMPPSTEVIAQGLALFGRAAELGTSFTAITPDDEGGDDNEDTPCNHALFAWRLCFLVFSVSEISG